MQGCLFMHTTLHFKMQPICIESMYWHQLHEYKHSVGTTCYKVARPLAVSAGQDIDTKLYDVSVISMRNVSAFECSNMHRNIAMGKSWHLRNIAAACTVLRKPWHTGHCLTPAHSTWCSRPCSHLRVSVSERVFVLQYESANNLGCTKLPKDSI